jgi:electron transfer flavoprotein alpha subunit
MTEKSVWVYIEHTDDHIAEVSLELTGKARELADTLGYEVVGLLFGHRVEGLAKEVIARSWPTTAPSPTHVWRSPRPAGASRRSS